MEEQQLDFGAEFIRLDNESRNIILANSYIRNHRVRAEIFIFHIVKYGTIEEKNIWINCLNDCLDYFNIITYNRRKTQNNNKNEESYDVNKWNPITYKGIQF
jgi:hypothetical protein